jgi:hypothetical protein
MSDEATVKLGEAEVRLRVVDAWTYTRIAAQPGMDWLTRLMSYLRVCWASKGRPGHGSNALDYEGTARAVFNELLERGATPEQIQTAGSAAFLLCFNRYNTAPTQDEEEDVESEADFSEAPAGSSESN